MIDFADVLAKRIREIGYKDAKTRKLTDISKGGIAVRRVSQAVINSYFDGEEDMELITQVVVARESELQAIEECEDIAQKVLLADLESENNSYRLTSVEIYTHPQELTTQSSVAIWQFRVRAEVTI